MVHLVYNFFLLWEMCLNFYYYCYYLFAKNKYRMRNKYHFVFILNLPFLFLAREKAN